VVTKVVAKHQDGDRGILLTFGNGNRHLHQESHVLLHSGQIHGLQGCSAPGLGCHAETNSSDPNHRYDGKDDVEVPEVPPGFSITHVVFLGYLGLWQGSSYPQPVQ